MMFNNPEYFVLLIQILYPSHIHTGKQTYVANVGFMLHDSVGDYSLYYILYYLYGVSDGRRVVMVKHEPT